MNKPWLSSDDPPPEREQLQPPEACDEGHGLYRIAVSALDGQHLQPTIQELLRGRPLSHGGAFALSGVGKGRRHAFACQIAGPSKAVIQPIQSIQSLLDFPNFLVMRFADCGRCPTEVCVVG